MTRNGSYALGGTAGAAALIAAVIICTIALSIFVFMGKSLRLDEAQSVWQTNHSFMGMLSIVAQDVHVPLYFIGLRSWEMAFGMSAAALRSFSLIFLLLSFPLLYLLARDAYSNRAAFLVVALAGASPFLHWFGSEARMYTLLLFFTVASQLCFVRIWKETGSHARLNWLVYTLAAVAGTYTHYFFLLVLLVQAIFYVTYARLFPARSLPRFLVVAFLVLAQLGAWIAFRTSIGTSDSDPLLSSPSSVDLFNVFSNFYIGLQSNVVNSFFLSLWPLLVFAGFAVLSRRKKMLPETSYFLMGLFVPIALAFLVSTFIRPLFLSRYLIICLPSLYLLTVHYITLYRKPTSDALFGAIIGCMLFSLAVEAFSPAVPANENFEEAAQYVESVAGAEDIFVVTAPFTTYPVEYYYRGNARLTTFPLWERYENAQGFPDFSEEYLAQQAGQWEEVYVHLYILMSYDQGYEEETRLYLDTHYQRIQSKEFSPGMNLYVYKLRYI